MIANSDSRLAISIVYEIAPVEFIVSFINSICHAFGSAITSKNSGILMQNRGVNFRLENNHPNVIDGHKRPLHTIIPGMLTNMDNQVILSYGVMGGQYQPIGQAHLLQNIFEYNMNIQEAIEFPRTFALNEKLKIEKSIPLEKAILNVYKFYQERLKVLNSCDFGDLILLCVTMFENNPDILDLYLNNFKYILVDEYQDSNYIQSKWLNLLAKKRNNICCVGDDDQSIYS